MGGDYAPEATVMGAIQARKELPDSCTVVLIGDAPGIEKILDREKSDRKGMEIVHTTQEITMSDHPTRVFSKKPDSSIAVGFNLLKKNELDAFASVGNTGAMLVGSMYTVRTIPGIIRPCITTTLPKLDGKVGLMLDVGTNADCRPDVLYQFAVLGSIFANHVYKIDNPKIGLLNIGEEEGKGNLLTQATYGLMKESEDFNFIGNVEGRDLFNDKADVIVCDGFTGNIVLKQIETMYHLIKSRGFSDEYFDRFNYEIYGGTPILGINSNVIIGHGISNPTAIKNMLLLSSDVVNARLSSRIGEVFN